MSRFLQPDDFAPFATIAADKLAAMISDAEATALMAAPCLSGALTDTQTAAVRSVLRGAVLRWNDSGSGALTQQTAGPFAASFDTRADRKGMFWPSEVAQLRDVCSSGMRAYTVSTAPRAPVGTPRYVINRPEDDR